MGQSRAQRLALRREGSGDGDLQEDQVRDQNRNLLIAMGVYLALGALIGVWIGLELSHG